MSVGLRASLFVGLHPGVWAQNHNSEFHFQAETKLQTLAHKMKVEFRWWGGGGRGVRVWMGWWWGWGGGVGVLWVGGGTPTSIVVGGVSCGN